MPKVFTNSKLSSYPKTLSKIAYPNKKNMICILGITVYRIPDFIIYSVMQSDGNSFFGDVVLDSCIMSYRNEDQTYEKQESWNFITKILEVIDENAYLKKYST